MWSPNLPLHAYTYGVANGPKELSVISKTLDIAIKKLVPQEYYDMMSTFEHDGNIPWHAVMPKAIYMQRLKRLFSSLWDAVDAISDGYGMTLLEQGFFFSRLMPAKINKAKYAKYANGEKNLSVLYTLQTFKTPSYYASVPQYSNDTTTGRLKIKSGPDILRLKKEYRDVITSTHEGGSIVYVDFVSLEPRLAAFMAGRTPKQDIYADIATNILHDKIDRKTAKLATISALYGASANTLKGILGANVSTFDILRNVKRYFDVDDRTNELACQLEEYEYIENYYGKKIVPNKESAIFNNYVQSSAVDVAIIGFNIFLRDLDVRPLFILHDALVLDVKKEVLPLVQAKVGLGIEIDKFGNFPIEMTYVTG